MKCFVIGNSLWNTGKHDEHIRNIIGKLLETHWQHGT